MLTIWAKTLFTATGTHETRLRTPRVHGSDFVRLSAKRNGS
jgi:hypothetical protein